MAINEELDEDLLEPVLEDTYGLVPDFGLGVEKAFNELPVAEVVPADSIIPIPEGLPAFTLPTTPAVPNLPIPKLDLPALNLPAVDAGSFSNLIPPGFTELFNNVKNDSGDPKVTQALEENSKSVVAFPVEPQAISKDIAKVAPQVSQDVLQDVIKNTMSLFLGVFVPGKAIFDMILGIKDKAEALGLDKLFGFGASLENKINELGSLDNLNGAMNQGLANSLNQAAGLSDMRQVPVGPRSILSSTIPQHAVVSDKANRADWPNGANVEDDVLARLANSSKMAEDAYNIAASLTTLEKSAAVLARSAGMLAQHLGNGALALQIDALMRAYSINSVNVNGSLPSRPALMKGDRDARVKAAATAGGQVQSGRAKGEVTGFVAGTLSGQLTNAEVSGTVSGKGSGSFSGNITAEITKGALTGGTTNADGSVSGGTLAVNSLGAVSVSQASGTAELTGTITGNLEQGSFSGSASGTFSGTATGVFQGTVEALGTTTAAVVRNTTVQGAAGSVEATGTGELTTATGSVVGAVSGTVSGASVTGGSAAAGTVAVSTITNPVYGPTGLLEGGTVSGVATELPVTGATVVGSLEGTASGSVTGLSGSCSISGQGSVEVTSGSVVGGTNLGSVPTSQSQLAGTLNGLNTRANGAMPGNLMDLAYGGATEPLTAGYLQRIPGKVADKLGSSNGRLLDSYMTDPKSDLDGLTEILPELLLSGNEDLQQLLAALRGLQELVIYLTALPDSTLVEMRRNVSQVGSDFLLFVETIRQEAASLGDPNKITTNYLRRSYTYAQRQVIRKFATLWDNLETDYTIVLNSTLKPVAEKVMLTRKRVFNR